MANKNYALLYGHIRVYRNGKLEYADGDKITCYSLRLNYGNRLVATFFLKDDSLVTKAVAPMVARAFVENPNNYRKIRHKDGNPFNVKASNLQWVSDSEVLKQSYKECTNKVICKKCKRIGWYNNELCSRCSKGFKLKREPEDWSMLNYLTRKQQEAYKLRKEGLTLQEIGDRLGVSRQAVHERLERVNEIFSEVRM